MNNQAGLLKTLNRDFIPQAPSIYLLTDKLHNTCFTNVAFRLFVVYFDDTPFSVTNVTNLAAITITNSMGDVRFITKPLNAGINCLDITFSEDDIYLIKASYLGYTTELSIKSLNNSSWVLNQDDSRRAYRRFYPQAVFTDSRYLPDGSQALIWTHDQAVGKGIETFQQQLQSLSNSLLASKSDPEIVQMWLVRLGLQNLNIDKSTPRINQILQFFETLYSTNSIFDLAYHLTKYIYIRTNIPTYVYVDDHFVYNLENNGIVGYYRVTANPNYPVNGVLLTSKNFVVGQAGLLLGDDGNSYNVLYDGGSWTETKVIGEIYSPIATLVRENNAIAGNACFILEQNHTAFSLPWDGIKRNLVYLDSNSISSFGAIPNGVVFGLRLFNSTTTQLILGDDGNIYTYIATDNTVGGKYKLRKKLTIEVQSDAANTLATNLDVQNELNEICQKFKIASADYILVFNPLATMHSNLTSGANNAVTDVLTCKYDNRTLGYCFHRYDDNLATKLQAYIALDNPLAIRRLIFATPLNTINVGETKSSAISLEYWDGTIQVVPDYTKLKVKSNNPVPNKLFTQTSNLPPKLTGGNQSVNTVNFSYRSFNQSISVQVLNTLIYGFAYGGGGGLPVGVILCNQYQAGTAQILLGHDGNMYNVSGLAIGASIPLSFEAYATGGITGLLIRRTAALVGQACLVIGNDGNIYNVTYDGLARAAAIQEQQYLPVTGIQLYQQPKIIGQGLIELNNDGNLYGRMI